MPCELPSLSALAYGPDTSVNRLEETPGARLARHEKLNISSLETRHTNIPVQITLPSSLSQRVSTKLPRYHNKNNLIKISLDQDSNHNNNPPSQRTHVPTEHGLMPTSQNNSNKRTNNSKFKIVHLNARSLKNRTNLSQIRELSREIKPDVLAISETWFNSTVSNAEVELEDFKLFRLDRLHKAGGGVCAYIRSGIKCHKLRNLSYISEDNFHQLWLQLQYKKLKSIVICVTYRPPDCPLNCFDTSFKPTYTKALLLGNSIFVLGDLNCNLLSDGPERRALHNTCNELNLVQIIESPTRVTVNSESLIDVILVSTPSLVKSSGVMQTSISDHYPVYVVLKLNTSKSPPCSVILRSFRNYDPTLFALDIAQSFGSFNCLLDQLHDVNDQVKTFNNYFSYVLDRHAPIKNIKIKNRSTSFVNREIKEAMRIRDKLHHLFYQTRTHTDWINYKSCRNTVKAMLRTSEKTYIRNQIHQCKCNSGALWKVIHHILPSKEISKPIYTKDTEKLAEEFNTFFLSVGETTAQAVKQLAENNNIQQYICQAPAINLKQPDEPFEFKLISQEDVRRIITAMPTNKSPGPDKVNMRVIKDSLPHIITALTSIINNSLLTSTYPDAWKLAEVIPILKDGDHEIASNNRPLSLLTILSKVCEKVVLNQFSDYLQAHNKLSPHQSGNKSLHSTETLNIFITDTILQAMDQKKLTALVLIDLSKAFDSICHEILLKKLEDIGASPSATRWFRSYISGRSQYVKIGPSKSTSQVITHGVPQGSILSPLLFSIYTNDLPKATNDCLLESYVDDSKVLLSFSTNNKLEAKAKLEEDLIRVTSWCCSNSLLINADKTKFLLFGSSQLLNTFTEDFSLNFLDRTLHPVISAKDLGVIMDVHLKFDEHISKSVSSCMSKLCQINRIRHFLDQETLTLIVQSLVLSKLFYCSSVWSGTAAKNIKKLQLIQNFSARIITNTHKYDHITPVLKELKWLPVDRNLVYRDTIQTHKCLNGLSPLYLSEKFYQRDSIHQHSTRNRNDLSIPMFQTSTGQRSFHYRAVKLWNNLDNTLKSIKNIKLFKVELKKHLLNA